MQRQYRTHVLTRYATQEETYDVDHELHASGVERRRERLEVVGIAEVRVELGDVERPVAVRGSVIPTLVSQGGRAT